MLIPHAGEASALSCSKQTKADTVYALGIELDLPGSSNFPANAETLYQALIVAGRKRHILASATFTGLYSATPGN